MKKRLFTRLAPIFDKQKSELQTEGEVSANGMSTGEEKDMLASVLDTASFVYALTVDGVIEEVNEYSRNYIGMEPGEDIKQFYNDLEQRDILIKNAGHNKQTIIGIKTKNDETRRFLGSIATADYRFHKAYILWGTEIGSAFPTDEESETETHKLESKILTDIYGEIRNPVNGIIRMTDLMLGEKITGSQIEYVTNIRKSAKYLQDISNVILDYTKISEGKMQITPVDIELVAFLRNIVSTMRFTARTKGLKFIDEINIKSPEYICADDMRLKQVLQNLLSNAIKFTESGTVTFLVKKEAGNVLFRVSDTGIGVKPENIPLLFEAFGHANERTSRGVKGSGLSLPLSKKLIEMMGGKIWVESEFGVGSYFYVTIPYSPGKVSDAAAQNTETEYIYAPTAKILLVDDIQSNLTVTAGMLQLCGITADVALSGMEAINLAHAKDYDIIFMDYMMPQMDGVEAMKRIRGLGEKYTKLPIIALTAGAVGEVRDFLLESGMDDFLLKPLNKNALMDVLRKWMPSDKIETVTNHDIPEHESVNSEILKSASLIKNMDIQLALDRISGMQDVLEKSLMQVDKAIGGQLKEMDVFLSENKLKDFSVAIHGMKGTLANIGAMRYSEMAAELEALSKAGDAEQCKQKFPAFSEVISGFQAELDAIFMQAESKDLPKGDRALLMQKAEAAISLLEKYEIAEARACINEALDFTYDDNTDRLLKEISDMVAAAKYKNAIVKLRLIGQK